MKKVLLFSICLTAFFINSCALFICDSDDNDCRDDDSDTITIITHGMLINGEEK